MRVSAIVACDRNGVIGINGKIPWHLPEDLKRFKTLTMGNPIIMGRKTFESLGKPLPGRLNLVVSRKRFEDKDQCNYESSGLVWCDSLESAINWAKLSGAPHAFIIGGSSLYIGAVQSYASTIYRTMVLEEAVVTTEDDVAYFPIEYFGSIQNKKLEWLQPGDRCIYETWRMLGRD